MSGARWTAVLVLMLAAAGCRSSAQMQESYATMNRYGSADQEAVVAEVSGLPYKHQKWSHRFADWPIRRLSMGRENLFIETPDHKVACINRFDGITKWVFEIPTRSPLDWTPIEPGEVYMQIRDYTQQLAAQTRVVEDILKSEGMGQKAQDAQRDKNRIYQLLNAAMRGDNVYLVSRQMLYCIARQTGKLLWQRQLPFAPSAKGFATRESLYMPAGDRPQVWRLDVERRGEAIQSFPADVGAGDRTIMNVPIFDTDVHHLYFACADGRCYAYNVNTGQKEWTYPAHAKLAADPLLHTVRERYVDSGGRETFRTKRYLFIGGLDYALYCLDPDTGTLSWKFETGGFLRSPIVVKDQTVYVKSDEGALFALELDPVHRHPKTNAVEGTKRGGQMRWKLPAGERFIVKGTGGDRVLVLGPNSELYLFAEMTGEIVGRYPLSEITHVLTNPHDSILYVATDGGAVFALEESGSSY